MLRQITDNSEAIQIALKRAPLTGELLIPAVQ
jgi:hypothetical protein